MDKSRGTALRVSDHALLRFIERAGGLEIEALRAKLEGSLKRAASAADLVSGGDYTIAADGLLYVVTNGTVVTIKPRPGHKARLP